MEQLKEPIAQGEELANEAGEPKKALPPKKKNRKKIRRIVALVLVLALAVAGWKFFGKGSSSEPQLMTQMVSYGSITAMVEGNGLTKAKNSETLTLTTPGTVQEVFVTEGQIVEEGTPLFTISSPDAESDVRAKQKEVEGCEKRLNVLYKNIASQHLSAPYSGKLMETVKLTPGDDFSPRQVATLVDDTQFRLTQYYSYAYADMFFVGQSVDVSIPAFMSTLTGTVEAVHKISRITPEGSKLFSVDIVLPNAGVLAKDAEASATMTVNGETIYPYETGKLDYYRTTPLEIKVSGTVISSALLDHLNVSAGQALVEIDGEDAEADIFSAEKALEDAQKKLEDAEKNLAVCSAAAPISGQVIGLTINPGDELTGTTAIVTISDTSTIIVNATVDERNVSYLKKGMMVNLDQWGNMAMGTVDSVSLSSTVNNGVASYPLVISADNSEGSLQVNSYINYNLTASQSDNCLVLPIQCVRTVSLPDGTMATVVYVQADEMPENAVELEYPDGEIPAGFYPVPVEIGIQDTFNVEIKSGVEEGTVVFEQMMSNDGMGGIMF